MHKMIDLVSTGVSISARLDNKNKHKYYVFAKLSLALVGACEVAKKIQLEQTNIYRKLIDTLIEP